MANVKECIAPGALEDWELEAYRDGAAGPHVAAHLAECAACRRRVAEAHLLEQRLRRRTLGAHCPAPEILHAYHWDELAATERLTVEQHLVDCAPCRADLAALAAFVAPRAVPTWERLWDNVKQAAEQAHMAVARLLTPGAQPVLALRGETRQVLFFEADPVAISVNVEQEETGGYTLFGQVLTETPAPVVGGGVRLTQPGSTPHRADVDVHGSFIIPGLMPGVYQLIVTLPEQRVVIPLLTLEAGG